MKYKISLAGIVQQGGDVLMVKEENSGKIHWDIPAGGVEIGETPEEALIREVLEETGVEIEDIVLKKVYYYIEKARTTVNLLFIAKARSIGAVQPQSKDIEEAAFLPKAKVIELIDKGNCENKLAERRLKDYLDDFRSRVELEIIREN